MIVSTDSASMCRRDRTAIARTLPSSDWCKLCRFRAVLHCITQWGSVRTGLLAGFIQMYLGVSQTSRSPIIHLRLTQSIDSFARDGAIPGSKYLARVSQRHQMPVNAFLLCVAVQVLLSCLYFGSTAAFNAFISGEHVHAGTYTITRNRLTSPLFPI